MSKQYEQLAHNIVQAIGGKENVSNAYHCQTRLRFSLKDDTIPNDEQVKGIDGVVTVMRSGGVYQVVIGTHVADVFEEVEKLVDIKPASEDASAPEGAGDGEKPNVMERVIDFVSGTFQPVIPALSGAGMVKAVMALLVVFKVIDNTSGAGAGAEAQVQPHPGGGRRGHDAAPQLVRDGRGR